MFKYLIAIFFIYEFIWMKYKTMRPSKYTQATNRYSYVRERIYV